MPANETSYGWLEARVPPNPMSMGYRLGLLVVAVMMIVLPLLYIELCLLMAYGIYFYATNETVLLHYRQTGFAAYFGVIIAGGIGLIFMVKPLFTRHRRVEARLELTPESQPELFAFIEEVCVRIGAPKPVKVLIDNQVNASASFENGLWGMLTNRLVLTIGLPLAQGLTISQFGGVLAHEFGHFTQSVAMRLNYIIRTINMWFNRVIYERDNFDDLLKQWTRGGNIYWMIMANIASAFIWFAREVLRLLMLTGHAVSAYMMRQMEYDADYYERQVAGTANFKATFLRMRVLNIGMQLAGNHLNETWKKGRLVDNLPFLTDHLVASISPEKIQAFGESFEKDQSVAKWHSTHPSDFQRIRHALKEPNEGILVGEEMGGSLFHRLDHFAREVTLLDYTLRLNLKVKPGTLIPIATYLGENSNRAQTMARLQEFFAGLLTERDLIFPEASGVELVDEAALRGRLQEVTAALETHKDFVKEVGQRLEAARTQRANASMAQAMIEIGLAIKAADLDLPDLEPDTLRSVIDACTAEIAELEAAAIPTTKIAQEKLHLSCQLAEAVAASSGAHAKAQRIRLLADFLVALQPIHALLSGYRRPFFTASIYVNNYDAAKEKKRAEALFETLGSGFKNATAQVELMANQMAYPLRDGNSYPHLTAYFLTGNNQPGAMGQYLYLRSIFERHTFLYTEVMVELFGSIPA